MRDISQIECLQQSDCLLGVSLNGMIIGQQTVMVLGGQQLRKASQQLAAQLRLVEAGAEMEDRLVFGIALVAGDERRGQQRDGAVKVAPVQRVEDGRQAVGVLAVELLGSQRWRRQDLANDRRQPVVGRVVQGRSARGVHLPQEAMVLGGRHPLGQHGQHQVLGQASRFALMLVFGCCWFTW